jgi:2-dehydro-3-deoxyphosphogluconate aldolase / (4S)-4-hydroxy-2-oxoglutarate aldolase
VGCIAEIVRAFPHGHLLIGMGSITDPYDCRRAVDAGARFVVTPGFVPHVIETAKVIGVPALSGAYTPSEIMHAHHAGADMVKVFPASVGGPELIRAIKGPLPHIPLVPTGGVTPGNMAEFFRAGAVAVAAGGNLADPKLIESGDMAGIQSRAEAFVEALAQVRKA